MEHDEILEVFQKMKASLAEKKSWQENKRKVYDGRSTAQSLNISLPKAFDKKLKTCIGWAKTAVDTLHNDIQFDGFSNDSLGFTKLLNNYGAYSVIDSAVKNSMIGACSFISVLPREDGTPFFSVFAGDEATGIYDARDGLIAGLTINSFKETFGYKTIQDYLLYLPGVVIKITSGGEIVSSVEMPTDKILLIPFIYEQDLATRPFGTSRINHAAENSLETALRTLKTIEIGNDTAIALRNILLAEGTDASEMAMSEGGSSMGNLTTITSNSGTLKLEQLTGGTTEDLQKSLSITAANFGNAVGMSSNAFGFQPSNGSYGDAALEEMGKPYLAIKKKQRSSYGDSIKQVAITAMALVTGQYDDEWLSINAEFDEEISEAKFGALADGLGKLMMSFPGRNWENYIDKKLGKSYKEEAMKVSLPAFSKTHSDHVNYGLLNADNDNLV